MLPSDVQFMIQTTKAHTSGGSGWDVLLATAPRACEHLSCGSCCPRTDSHVLSILISCSFSSYVWLFAGSPGQHWPGGPLWWLPLRTGVCTAFQTPAGSCGLPAAHPGVWRWEGEGGPRVASGCLQSQAGAAGTSGHEPGISRMSQR